MKNKNYDKKTAFTLAEVLITIAVIGAIAALTMPLMQNAIPNKYEAMHKKADYALEHTVSDIVNDDYLYGAQKESVQDPANPAQYITTTTYGLKNTYRVTVNGRNYQGDTKFCELFASRFNLYPGSNVNCNDNSPGFSQDGRTPTFISADGIQWLITKNDFSDSGIVIAFKVSAENDANQTKCGNISNGFATMPVGENRTTNYVSNKLGTDLGIRYANSRTGSNKNRSMITSNNSCTKPDIFIYALTPEGKLIKDTPTSDTLSSSNASNSSNPPRNETIGAATSPGNMSPALNRPETVGAAAAPPRPN